MRLTPTELTLGECVGRMHCFALVLLVVEEANTIHRGVRLPSRMLGAAELYQAGDVRSGFQDSCR